MSPDLWKLVATSHITAALECLLFDSKLIFTLSDVNCSHTLNVRLFEWRAEMRVSKHLCPPSHPRCPLPLRSLSPFVPFPMRKVPSLPSSRGKEKSFAVIRHFTSSVECRLLGKGVILGLFHISVIRQDSVDFWLTKARREKKRKSQWRNSCCPASEKFRTNKSKLLKARYYAALVWVIW